jgi:hypothetical protein
MNSPYRVVYSEAVRVALKELRAKAVRKKLGPAFLSALKTIDARLRSDPLAFGDPWFHLPAGKLRVMIRVFPPLVVAYAVHTERSIVFVKGFRAFPSTAF